VATDGGQAEQNGKNLERRVLLVEVAASQALVDCTAINRETSPNIKILGHIK